MTLDDETFKGGDWKQPPRVRDSKAMKQAHKAVGRECVICGVTKGLTVHHVLSRSLGGDDDPANLVMLDGTGTTGCHGDVEARRNQARKILGQHLVEARPDTIAYIRKKLAPGGDAWLKKNYGVKTK